MSFVPWQWRPDTSAWFYRIVNLTDRWNSSEKLCLDEPSIRAAVVEAAEAQCEWLIHPCLNPLTCPNDYLKDHRDLQLSVWTALHSEKDLGRVVLDQPVWLWSFDGGTMIEPGSHDLRQLAERLCRDAPELPIAIDPWSHSTKVKFHQLWRDAKPLREDERTTLQSELRLCVGSILRMKEMLPDCLSWICSRTKVIVPLRSLSGEHSSSSSAAELPGVVFLTLHNQVQAIEALVHESAHQHLFMAESAGALVSPDHDGMYSSPLRDDARPLRGILLAAHALAFMKAYYEEAISVSLASSSFLQEQLNKISNFYEDAYQTLSANRGHLTERGNEFLHLTGEVGNYGD